MSTRNDSSIKTARGYFRYYILFASGVFVASAYMTPQAAPNPMINYFKPIPIVGKLATSGWGYKTVGPHDASNGLENTSKYWYWDGKILKAPNGKYHLFASRWDVSLGISAWQAASISTHAVSDSLLGPYQDLGPTYAYQNSKGHNTTGLMLRDSTYAIIESAVVPGWIFTSKTLDGSFTYQGSISWNDNGFNIGSPTANLTTFVGPDNKYWAFSNTGAVMNSDNVLGKYEVRTSRIYLPNPGEEDSSNSATAGKILVVPFDGVKFDADSGGTSVTTRIAGGSGKVPGGMATDNMHAHYVDGVITDLSGRVVDKNAFPRSGVYMVQTGDGRSIKKTLIFSNKK